MPTGRSGGIFLIYTEILIGIKYPAANRRIALNIRLISAERKPVGGQAFYAEAIHGFQRTSW